MAAAEIVEGAVFRRVWAAAKPEADTGQPTRATVDDEALDAGPVARIINKRAATAGYDPTVLGGHGLKKRGTLTTGVNPGVHSTRLKQLRR